MTDTQSKDSITLTCTLTPTTRGEYNVARGWLAGRSADVPGYCVVLTGAEFGNGHTLFLTDAEIAEGRANRSTLTLEHPADALLYAEKAMYVQNLRRLQAQIEERTANAKTNGSFDPYLDQIMIPRAELLVKLIDNMDEGFTHD